MTTTTSTSALTGGAASLAITGATSQGIGILPVFASAVNAAVPGCYIVASPDFSGTFQISRHLAGFEAPAAAGDPTNGGTQVVLSGDRQSLLAAGGGPLATLTSCDSVTLTLTSRTAGSITMSVVQ